MTPIARWLISEWFEELTEFDARIKSSQAEQARLVEDNPAYPALQEIPGFGPVISTVVLAAVGTARQFDIGHYDALARLSID